jgi:serine phosphatase RsbU (regulator of sigma subunit)/tetratricopeptide (TPR) repeat protein
VVLSMTTTFRIFSLIVFWLSTFGVFGQSEKVVKALNCRDKHDELYNLADYYYTEDAKKSLEISQELLKLAEKCQEPLFFYSAYISLGWAYVAYSDFPNAITYGEKALAVAKEIKDSDNIINACNLLGTIYLEIPDRDFALKYYLEGIEEGVKMGDEEALSNLYNNVAIAYEHFDNLEKSLEYYLKARKVFENSSQDYDRSLIYLNIGDLYYQLQTYDSAQHYLKLSRKFLHPQEDADLANLIYQSLAINEARLGRYTLAIAYLDSAFNCLGDGNSPTDFVNFFKSKSDILFQAGKYKDAYQTLLSSYTVKDSIFSHDIMEKLRDAQITAITNKKEKEIAELTQKNEIQQLRIAENHATQRLYIWAIVLAAIICSLLVVVFVNSRKNAAQLRKRNLLIEVQSKDIHAKNDQLEQVNKEITDSINYAQRIQQAILPSAKVLSETLKNGFVLFRPKDVVSGDFYWLEKLNDIIYFAAADCTGHGVPGAMVSVVCSNALSKALLEEGKTKTSDLLDKTRELVIKQFGAENNNDTQRIQDGMDISLCAWSVDSHVLEWSGANNPLWIIRSNNQGTSELIEFKPDKQPVASYTIMEPFTSHQVQLQKGDTLYIFTDGYQDQFGGSVHKKGGKKFKVSRLKELIISIQHLSMDEQHQHLLGVLEEWRGDIEQIDDICIIGVRI